MSWRGAGWGSWGSGLNSGTFWEDSRCLWAQLGQAEGSAKSRLDPLQVQAMCFKLRETLTLSMSEQTRAARANNNLACPAPRVSVPQ